MRVLKRVVLLLVVLFATMSCGAAKLANVGKNLELIKIEKLEIKGLSGLQITAEVNNDSKHGVAMEGGKIELMLDGKPIGTLTQVGRVEVLPRMHGVITSLWKIDVVDPMMMFKLTAKIATKDYSGLLANYEATLSSGNTSRRISGKAVDIQKLLAIFAS